MGIKKIRDAPVPLPGGTNETSVEKLWQDSVFLLHYEIALLKG